MPPPPPVGGSSSRGTSKTGSDTSRVSPRRDSLYTRAHDLDRRADGRRPLDRRRLGCRRRGEAGDRALRGRARQDARRPGRRRRGRARRPRAHLRRQHRLRQVRFEGDPRGADGRAPAAAASLPRVRGGGAVSRPGRACGDAPACERTREGQLGRARRDRRVAARVPEPRRPAVRARTWLGRCVRRSRAACPPCPAAGRRGACVVGRRPARRRRGARASRPRARSAACQGGPVADQRHAVHGCAGCACARPCPAPGPHRRLCMRSVARSAAGLAQLVHPAGACSEAACAARRRPRET